MPSADSLRRGLGINVLDTQLSRDSFSIGCGLKPLQPPAHAQAVVPLSDWRALTDEEWNLLHNTKLRTLKASFSVFGLPAELSQRLHELAIPVVESSGNAPTLGAAQRASTIGEIREAVIAHLLATYGIRVGGQKSATDLVVHLPGRDSTAYNYDEDLFMGLHIDNHQSYGFRERDRSDPLVSLNLGFTSRALHFCNLSVSEILDIMVASGAGSTNTTFELKNAFFDMVPQYPILRYEMQPGQGYIVNAHDVIHDGSTNRDGFPDINLLSTNEFVDDVPVRAR